MMICPDVVVIHETAVCCFNFLCTMTYVVIWQRQKKILEKGSSRFEQLSNSGEKDLEDCRLMPTYNKPRK